MIIPINLPADSDGPSNKFPPQLAKLGSGELILVELQGSFHTEGDSCGQLAARLRLENEAKPTLLIGHNLLEGKIVNLSKPLAVLHKKGSDDRMQVDDGSTKGHEGKSCEYEILAVVRRKVLFSKRPMPVVNMAPNAAHSGSEKP